MDLSRSTIEQQPPQPVRVLEHPETVPTSLEADRLAEAELAKVAPVEKAAGFLAEAPPAPGMAEAAPPDALLSEVERILEKNLAELVEKNLPPDHREKFVAAGRALADRILALHDRDQADRTRFVVVRWLLRHLPFRTTLTHESLVGLVRRWLQALPKTNRFFLEQDAKIAADEILAHLEEATTAQAA